jgi:AraC-like DNA-binding protein/mannose-6-phosphate isomerase-like protein (cupin superfamily)
MVKPEVMSMFISLSEEEKIILNTGLYSLFYSNVVNSSVLDLKNNNEMLSITQHVRFIDCPKHKHDYIEMIYVLQGELHQTINNKSMHLKQGEVLFLNKNIEHEIHASSQQDIILNFIIYPEFLKYIYSIMDRENRLSKFFQSSDFNDMYDAEYIYYKVSHIDEIQTSLHKIIDVYYLKQKMAQEKIKFILGYFFIQLLEQQERAEFYVVDNFEKRMIRKIMNYLDENYKTARLQKIADQLNYSPDAICKILKENLGLTFKELLQRKRLEKATELLIHSSDTVESVIYKVGYDNATYFYRIFKGKYNCSLKEYRDLNRRIVAY